MPQFQPLRSTKNNAPGDRRRSTLFITPTARANVTRALPMEPETAPLAIVAQTNTTGNPSTQGLQWQPQAPYTPLPPAFKSAPRLSGEVQANMRYLPVPVRNVNTQVSNVNTQGRSNNRYVSISFPMNNVSAPIVRGSAVVVQKMPLVIPGTRKRLRDTDAINIADKPLHSRLRHALVILAAIGTFLIIMFSLTPLGQENGSLLTGFIQSKNVAQSNLSVMARNNGLDPNVSNGTDYGYTTDQYIAMARADAVEYGISPDLYQRQIQQESHFDPNAVSWVGAIGIAQFMPGTAADMHFDPHDPVAALKNGAIMMGNLNSTFNGNYAMALAGYNAGPGAVDVAVNNCGGAWLSCMDPQSQAYVYIIMG